MKKYRPAVVVCPSEASFRATEIIIRYLGYRRNALAQYDTLIGPTIKRVNPSKNGKYLLYLTPGTPGIYSYDHDGIGLNGEDLLTRVIKEGLVKIITTEELMNYLDNPPSGFPPVTIALNIEYSAEITDGDVKVGCQTFTHDVILKVAEEINKRK